MRRPVRLTLRELATPHMRLHGQAVRGRRELQTQTRGEFASATAAVLASVTARRVCNAYRLRGWQRLPARTAPACGNGRAGLVSLGNASDRGTAHYPGVLACYAAQLHLYIGSVTAYRLTMLATPSIQVARYRGTAAGWQAIGRPRSAADAARFVSLWARIDPAATLRARPILPGETMPPVAPSHGNAAPELPSIAAAFTADNARLRAIGDLATASAFARIAGMRATIDAELARD
jgi:hypothetical protein